MACDQSARQRMTHHSRARSMLPTDRHPIGLSNLLSHDMSASHQHQHGAECQHDDDELCEHEHGAAAAAANATAAESSPAAASASIAPAVHTHSHAHGGNSGSASSSSHPCDYCSSIKAHGKAQKAAAREEARRLAERRIANHAEAKASERMGGRPLAPPPDEWSDEVPTQNKCELSQSSLSG